MDIPVVLGAGLRAGVGVFFCRSKNYAFKDFLFFRYESRLGSFFFFFQREGIFMGRGGVLDVSGRLMAYVYKPSHRCVVRLGLDDDLQQTEASGLGNYLMQF